jgi:ribose transport system substrate-binding protein
MRNVRRRHRSAVASSGRGQRTAIVAATLGLVVAVAACGPAASSAGTNGNGAGNSASDAALVAAADAAVTKDTAGPTDYTGPTDPVPVKSGVKLALIPCSAALEGCTEWTNAAAELAHVLGWQVRTYDAQGTPEGANTAVEQAVNGGANVILTGAVNPQFYQAGLAAARARHIVVGDLGGGYSPSAGIDFGVNINTRTFGEMLGDALVADSKGQADVLPFTDDEYATDQPLLDGLLSKVEACSTCTLQSTQKFVTTDITSRLGPTTVDLLRRDPKIDYVYGVFDGAASSMVTAIAGAGMNGNIKVVAATGAKQNLQWIIDKHIQSADVVFDATYGSYIGVYQAARILAGQKLWTTPGATDPTLVNSGDIPVRLYTWTAPPPTASVNYNADGTLHYKSKLQALFTKSSF